MINVPVCIIGCGPIGLAGALLLAKFGVKSLLIDKRSEINTHPRSRFVDTNTMELMRLLGVEKEVEATGLGPEWTEYNRWFNTFEKPAFANIRSPTFHTVPRKSSPSMPVMTCQDYVEEILLAKARSNEFIELRYQTEAVEINQNEAATTVVIHDLISDERITVLAEYTLGTDGPHSFVRETIGSELKTAPLEMFMQDVIFEADLSDYVEKCKGGLLYHTTNSGGFVFQPLNGITRWRCQIPNTNNEMLSEEETVKRICETLGTDQEVPISITSSGMWRPTPGCVDTLSRGRVFLAGDAAHVAVPTGGMGNNIGFAGIRNLTWKLAYVLRGVSPRSILDTYQIEHRPIALERIAVGVKTTESMLKMYFAFNAGMNTADAVRETQQYADYDGTILGFELESNLIAENSDPPPEVENPVIDFIPAIRAGRRAPHEWVDESRGQSILDWFGMNYVLIAGRNLDYERWERAVSQVVANTNITLDLRRFEEERSRLYDPNGLVLVRPDGIIADHWKDAEVADESVEGRLSAYLPLTQAS